jgi:hypothetical protein
MPSVLQAMYVKTTFASVKHSDVPSTATVPPATFAAIISASPTIQHVKSTAIAERDIIVTKDHVRRE